MAAVNSSSEIGRGGGSGKGEIMLFGVRVVIDPMRKCVSLNNLSDYEESPAEEKIPKITTIARDGEDKIESDAIIAAGYSSANDAVQISSSSGGNRERKRGVPWSEKEHKRFLIGLKKIGKGDWKGISRNFVKSRTPTQVASHAQKYFLRRTNLNRCRRRRSSLFDITTETVMEQDQVHNVEDNSSLLDSSEHHQAMFVSPQVAMPTRTENVQAKPTFNINTDVAGVPDTVSLNLSLASSYYFNEQSESKHSTFLMMSSFSNGDSNSSSNIIKVA